MMPMPHAPVAVGGAIASAILAACGSGGEAAKVPWLAKVEGSTAIHAKYESMGSGGEAAGSTAILDVVVDGKRLRMSTADKAEPSRIISIMVWDGHALLLEEPGAGLPSRQEDPPPEQRPASLVMHEGDEAFTRACLQAKRIGAVVVAERNGTSYACAADNSRPELGAEAHEITLDDATGLLLRHEGASSRMVATEVVVGVGTDDATFSTELTGNETTAAPLTAVAQVPRVGGGTLELAEVRQGPSLVVIGELDGLRAMLAVVLPMTENGSKPPVYGLLNAETSAQAGSFTVPVGVDIKGGAAGEDLRPHVQIMSGTTVLAAINADGSLAWKMTDADLAASSQKLKDWVVATS
jgi:hypothetical protein